MFRLVAFFFTFVACSLATPIALSPPSPDHPASLYSRITTTAKYRAVREAARRSGSRLLPGEWHYFRVCVLLTEPPENDIQRDTGCQHHMFLVGSVSQQSSDSAIRFEGILYHVIWDWAIVKWEWRDHQWNIREGQQLYYGGKTTEAKAAESNLHRLGEFESPNPACGNCK